MNAALQALYMNPIFRQIIYDLPLAEDDNIAIPSNFVKEGYGVLLAVQKLFIKLQKLNIRSITTTDLTHAFNWNDGEGRHQQDSQEFIKLFLFEALEPILLVTPFNGVIDNLFKTVVNTYITCTNCNNTKSREEVYLDIPLPVKGIKSVNESLDNLFNNYEIIEDYKCDNCNTKANVKKATKLANLPVLLNFPLNRFDYDLNTGERIKIRNKFEFPLEINMISYIDGHSNKTEADYELHAVIIHQGTPYSGHYFSYIRDIDNEGNWDLPEIKAYREEPEVIEVVKIEEDKDNKNDKAKGKKKHNKAQKKKDDNLDDEAKRLNYDNCDHPIEYVNKDLSKRWFCFNDTSIIPVRIGRLRKAFQGAESAYILCYMKKATHNANTQNKSIPPIYLENYIKELNDDLNKQRKIYEEEIQSLLINIYEESLFTLDEFNFIKIVKPEFVPKFTIKMKFLEKFSKIYEKININLKLKLNESENESEGYNLYEFSYKNNNIILLNKFSLSEFKDFSLEDLKVAHNSNFILIKENSENLKSIVIDSILGIEYEPVTVRVINGNEDKIVRCFGKVIYLDFKAIVKANFTISADEFSLFYKNGNNNVFLDKIAFDSKNKVFLNAKQMRLGEKDKAILFVSKATANKTAKIDQYDVAEKVTVLIRTEDNEENVTVAKIALNKTFNDLILKIKKKLNINGEIRVRKEIDGKILFKDKYNLRLDTDEAFIEGSVRVRVELGEAYDSNQILLKVLFELEKEKVIKDLVVEPNVLIRDVKKVFCTEFNLKAEDFQFYKTNAMGDPVKAIKNENISIAKSALNDNDLVYFKNIYLENANEYLLNFYINKSEQNSCVFKPIPAEAFAFDLKLDKDTLLETVRENVKNLLNLTNENIRLRIIGKKFDSERILKQNFPLKKLNLDNPQNILIEVLDSKEDLKENQIQLYLYTRNKEKKIYENKREFIFEYLNNCATSDQLYSNIRAITKDDFSIVKYAKHYYTWELVPEIDENGVINLRKGPYNLKDGDYIGLVKSDTLEDDYQTEEDKSILNAIKAGKIETTKANAPKRKEGPPLIIKWV